MNSGKLHVEAVLYALHGNFNVKNEDIDKAILLLHNEKTQSTITKGREWAIDYEINELKNAKSNEGYGVSI